MIKRTLLQKYIKEKELIQAVIIAKLYNGNILIQSEPEFFSHELYLEFLKSTMKNDGVDENESLELCTSSNSDRLLDINKWQKLFEKYKEDIFIASDLASEILKNKINFWKENIEDQYFLINSKYKIDPDVENDVYYNFERNENRKNQDEVNCLLPRFVKTNPILRKYWANRYRLFSKFDHGIMLDYESWFSVTPEKIAKHTAGRCSCDLLIDAFCGAGGNTIQFTSTCKRVYAIDIDPQKIAIAKHNAEIYGVEKKIEFILGDFLYIAEKLSGDIIFLSPPWGGPSYNQSKSFDINNLMCPAGGKALLKKSKHIANKVVLYLPKNINILQLIMTVDHGSIFEIEQNFIKKKLIAITAYY